MLTEAQKEQLELAMALLNQADVLLQAALGASDECYFIHSQIENAADDIQDVITESENATL